MTLNLKVLLPISWEKGSKGFSLRSSSYAGQARIQGSNFFSCLLFDTERNVRINSSFLHNKNYLFPDLFINLFCDEIGGDAGSNPGQFRLSVGQGNWINDFNGNPEFRFLRRQVGFSLYFYPQSLLKFFRILRNEF
jgi:hypothetical protein